MVVFRGTGDAELTAKVLRVLGIWKERDIVDPLQQGRLTSNLTGCGLVSYEGLGWEMRVGGFGAGAGSLG